MKIGVTGGAGFIGSHVIEELVQRHEVSEIISLDNYSSGSLANLNHAVDVGHANVSMKWYCGDVTNQSDVERLRDCDMIFHLADVVGVDAVLYQPVKTAETAALGVMNLFNQLKKWKKIFISSTSQLYGLRPGLCRVDAEIKIPPRSPVWIYAAGKLFQEYYAVESANHTGRDVVIGRFFNVVGPRQSVLTGHVLPRFVSLAMQNEGLKVYGDGGQSRAFIHVKDAAAAVVKSMFAMTESPFLFNIGNRGMEYCIHDLAEMVIKVTNSKSKIFNIGIQPGYKDVMYRTPDTNTMGIFHKPKHNNMEEIIREMMVHLEGEKK